MSQMTIGRLAEAAGVNVETVRYYHRRGLLPVPPRLGGSVRRYPEQALTRLRFIKRAQALGFTLEEVEMLLSLQDGQACSAARSIGEHRLADVKQRIQHLRALENALQLLVRKCATSPGHISCSLIDALT